MGLFRLIKEAIAFRKAFKASVKEQMEREAAYIKEHIEQF